MNIFDMTLKEQSELLDEILIDRLDNLLPELMKELNVECWIITGREYNEDPVLLTMLPSLFLNVRRTSILIFLYVKGVYKKIAIEPKKSELNLFYECVWDNKNEKQCESLKRIIELYDPKNIAMNTMSSIPFADGLTIQLYSDLRPYITKKIMTAERLCVRWLETRLDAEIEIMKEINEKTHQIVDMTFTRDQITHNKTTTSELEWVMRENIKKMGGEYWFGPDVDFQREKEGNTRQLGVLKEGDIIHCDVGIKYMRYNSDIQKVGYILKNNETEVPNEIQLLFDECIDLQTELKNEFVANKTGNEILRKTLDKVKSKPYKSMIYTHPIGLHGHGAGPAIGRYDRQEGVPVIGELKLNDGTCYAMELNTSNELAMWNNQNVYIYLEENIVFKDNKVEVLNERKTQIIKI